MALEQYSCKGDAYYYFATGYDPSKVKEKLKTLKGVVGAFMLRRTKSRLLQCGNLILPPLTEITVYVSTFRAKGTQFPRPVYTTQC